MLAESLDESRDIALLEGFDMNDLEPSSLDAYRNLFRSTKSGHPWLEYNDKELLRRLGGWTKDRQTGREGLTLAGLLMFGRLRPILDATANYLVDYQERSGDGDQRWIDRVTTDGSWSGNLFDFYRLVYRKLVAELKVPFRLKEKGRRIDETHVHEALREAIVNALIHADYSGSIGILIVKFPNGFYFRNPGGLRLPLATVLEGGTSDCRNRNLQKMFQLSGAGEQAGSGMPKILRAWKKQHWRTPLLREEQDMKQTVLRLSMVSLLPQETIDELGGLFGKKFGALDEVERLALATAHMEGTLTNQRLKEISSEHPRDLTFVLGGLVEQGFLEKSGVGRGTVYSLPGGIRGHMLLPLLSVSATMQVVHDLKGAEAIERISHKASSLQHKDINPQQLSSLREVARKVRSKKRVDRDVMESMILMLCKDTFLSRRELADLVGRSPASLQNHYLSRMVKKGLLALKYPDNPGDPGQKYRTKGSSPQHKEIIPPT